MGALAFVVLMLAFGFSFDVTPSSADGAEFGQVAGSSGSSVHVFVISNTRNSPSI